MGVTLARIHIPAEVKDNSQTVTDEAFMKHRAPGGGRCSWQFRDNEIGYADTFGYAHHQWEGVSPTGQRERFDMLVSRAGVVVHLFHTLYWTRTACAECEYSYASVYQKLVGDADAPLPVPRCDMHAHYFRRAAVREGMRVLESEPLLIGQHD